MHVEDVLLSRNGSLKTQAACVARRGITVSYITTIGWEKIEAPLVLAWDD